MGAVVWGEELGIAGVSQVQAGAHEAPN